MKIKIKRTHKDAIIPTYESELSAGFDFYAVENAKINSGETVIVDTGLRVELPAGYELQVRPRSGMSLRTRLRIPNTPGTIDADYRGEVGIIIENLGVDYQIKQGDRIAQGVINRVPQAKFVEVNSLSDTSRGGGGFGHTGR